MTKKDKNKNIMYVAQPTTQEVGKNSITIRPATRIGRKQQHKRYYRREIIQGKFLCALPLTADAGLKQAQASFEDGIADITLAKPETNKPTSIEIK